MFDFSGCTDFSRSAPTQGLHPRIIAEGFEAAKEKALAFLEEVKVVQEMDRETLISVARTSLRTKVHKELADLLTEVSMEELTSGRSSCCGQLLLVLKKSNGCICLSDYTNVP